MTYSNGSGDGCPLSPETINTLAALDGNISRLEVAIRDNTSTLRDGLRGVTDEVRSVRTELVAAATNRDFVHKDIVRVLILGLLALDAMVIVWFTGVAPMLSRQGVSFDRVSSSQAIHDDIRVSVPRNNSSRG